MKIYQTKKTNKKRIVWLDMLRVMAACAVVLMHALTGGVDIMNSSAYGDGKLMLAVMDLVTWCVPVFLIISGYLFLDPARRIPVSVMIRKYCLRIVLALLVFGIPFSCLELVLQERTLRIGMLWEGLLMVLTMRSWSHLWYLYLILLLYLLTPVFQILLAKIPRPILAGLMILLATGCSLMTFLNKVFHTTAFPSLPEELIYLFYYLFGYVLHWGEEKTTEEHRKKLWFICGSGALLLCGLMVWNRMTDVIPVQMAYSYPFTVILALLLVVWAKNGPWDDGKRREIWTRLSALSFAVYLIHPVFLHILYKVGNIVLWEHPLLVVLPIIWISVLLVATGSAALLYRIKWLRKYVL